MADAELGLLLHRTELPSDLIQTAWYLHGIASVNGARERYSLARQRQAFLVSAHIFDLALVDTSRTQDERLSFAFAAAIGYRRGGRDPNAAAIAGRMQNAIDSDAPLAERLSTFSMEIGVAFLGLNTRVLFRLLAKWRRSFSSLAKESGLDNLSSTAFGPNHLLVLGAEDLLMFLVRGSEVRRNRANARFLSVVQDEVGPEDLNSRWVAAHLLSFSDAAFAGSLWNAEVIPATVSSLVREAFTTGKPAVTTLWEPQRELLTGTLSPFDRDVRRMILSVPTSGGKTLIAQLLAVEYLERSERSICYVAPTRSLGREVRQAMASRIRVLQKEAGAEQPDYPVMSDFHLVFDAESEPADVEVMTPERLSHMLRHDSISVVEKFGMFIFDEAQLLKEKGRGFALESVIATLDSLTRESDHRIVLISAAMGNSGAIAQWLSPGGDALIHESDWRGPRRLHAVFNTRANWNSTIVESGAGPVWRYRHTTELRGVVRVRTANGRTSSLTTQGDTGWRLVRKSKNETARSSEMNLDSTRSTKQYKIAAEMIAELGHAGSVLVVASTKAQAQSLATALAEPRGESSKLIPLVDFVRQQLGSEHPLVDNLRHGVGFHHAGLPIEVLEAIEKAARDDLLPYLTCTSTLTDGVNLPVRTVVLYDQGYPGQPEDTRLQGARLVNAMGRAGRAGRETEGWIVLVRAAEASEQDFADLNPDSDDLAVMSSLLTADALMSVAELERKLRENADALFHAQGAAADFVSFVWLMLAIDEEGSGDEAELDVSKIVDTTLLASQSAEARTDYLAIAAATRSTYLSVSQEARLRWPRTGTSIGSSRFIDSVAEEIANKIVEDDLQYIDSPDFALQLLGPVLEELLGLREAPKWEFRATSQGANIRVEPDRLLQDWMSGASLSDLAEAHLSAASPAAWRIEQMVAAVTQQFEHYLAWTVGAVTDLVNWHLDNIGYEQRLCSELSGFIRYGVRNSRSLQLMTSGIRSRRLCHLMETMMPEDVNSTDDMRTWLSQMTISTWRDRFRASSSELLDLVEFTRTRGRSLLRALLETGVTTASTSRTSHTAYEGDPTFALRPIDDDTDPAPLGVYLGDDLIATIAPSDHADIQSILDTGLNIDVSFRPDDESILFVTLSSDESVENPSLF
ncbi:DEAD/DEAH box helicase [Salinibacterium sp. NG253]|uniref:DEAD/DEAH box helicase n=1 Tax=Salinibacterium sp. NG253 TaxID=2792039 RepID=UPI0018CE88EB|nr:DEAD/DEAH box helicase [Salinibacterium sp. NG253]MBH0115253.1 DEAD/DEAH box helicase [Salinibacterium sp. NG253]